MVETFNRDLTKRTQAESPLRASELRYRRLFESAKDGILILDGNSGQIVDANPFIMKTLGYSYEELIGKELWEIGVFKDIAAAKMAFEELQDKGYIRYEDLPLETRGGLVTEVEFVSNIYPEGDSKVIQCNIRDITERKRADAALRESEQRLKTVIENLREGLVTSDLDGQLLHWNRAALEMHGFASLDECLLKLPEFANIFKLSDLDGSIMDLEQWPLRRIIRGESLRNLEVRIRRIDHEWERVLSYGGNILREASGRLVAFVTISDITERKRFEQMLQEKNVELKNANLAKDRFLANMSHELRTPLNAIIGFTGTLLMKLPGPLNADQEHQLSTVQSSARHLLSLINGLLDLAKIESGKVEIKYEPIVCQSVIEEVAAALQPLAAEKNLDFTVQAPKTGLRIKSDRQILCQILFNLSNNAIKFTEKGQVRLELEIRQSNGHSVASIEVIDTGIGIRTEDQEKLFQAFQQVRNGHWNQGTGLGLYLSQKLAMLIKGEIEFESQYGKGSIFRLLLPVD